MALERLTQITSVGISSGITLNSATLTGVTTLTTASASGNISAVDGTFSGDLNVAGTLTYEDVSNIDSVGVITARSGLNVTGGNVGIGTDSAGTDLHLVTYGGHGKIRVESSGDGNRAGIEFFRESSAGTGKGAAGIWVESETGNSSGELRFGTANNSSLQSFTTKMILDSSGNLGIGNTVPISQLTVGDDVINATAISISSPFATNNYGDLVFTTLGTTTYNARIRATVPGNGTRELSFITAKNASENTVMTLDGDGNVGIGSTIPQSKLDVAGEIRASGIAITESYPTILPSLNLNFGASRSLDPRITFTRASVGTYVGPDGLIKTAGENEPRFDHDQNTLESLGLLIENAKVNSLTNSQPQSGSFTGGDATITYNTATAPNGATEACRIARNGSTSGSNYWRATRSITFNSNTMVLSCWAKAQDGNNYFVWSFQNLGGAIVRAGFKLTGDGETSIITNGNGGHTLQIEKYPDGWYRCIIIGNTQSSGTTTQFLYTASSYSEGNSAVGGSTLVWGFQLEAGNFPTSYIPTDASTATRGSDIATIDGGEFSDFYNEIEGTIVGEFTIDNIDNSAAAVANINASSGSSYADSIMFIEIGNDNGYFGRAYKSSSGLSLANASSVKGTLFPSTTPQSVAFAYTTVSGGELAAYWNGNYVNSNSNLSTVPSGLTELRIGRGWTHTSGVINARIKRLSYYPKRLVNNQLIAITS